MAHHTSSIPIGDPGQVTLVMASQARTGEPVEIGYRSCKVIGTGSFGVVFQAQLEPRLEPESPCVGNTDVAIKKVLQDKRFKNRELQIMRIIDHPNVCDLRFFFYSHGSNKDQVYLNLVMEYVPETIYRSLRNYVKTKQNMPPLLIKLYMYQLLRSLVYIHSIGICHRDIKPQNLLLNPQTGVLKLCDFGSAKILVAGEPNVSYICSRYYRAPELIFGATNYTTSIDIWSSGCVMAELMHGQPFFPGKNAVDQLVEIIKILGTPTREQVGQMNKNYMEHKFPQIRPHPLNRIFRPHTAPDAIHLLAKMLDYTPSARITAVEALAHPYFDELRQPPNDQIGHVLANGQPVPALFDFTREELSARPDLIHKLIPKHAELALKERGIDVYDFVPIPPQELRVSLD